MNNDGMMLVSKEKGIYKKINSEKVSTGSFYTEKDTWLTKPVDDFIKSALNSEINMVVDPFAGDGHLLKLAREKYSLPTRGLDIKSSGEDYNDSLVNIPIEKNSIIITNPPYLAKYSAKRKGVMSSVLNYFDSCKYDDLYQLALEKCLKATRYTVAIIPETFINSSFKKHHVVLCNVLFNSPFNDTDNPVCVVCLDNTKYNEDFNIYLDDALVTTNKCIQKYKIDSPYRFSLKFNDPNGNIGLKAVDGTKPGDKIRFMRAEEFDYPIENIKISSRLSTYIQIEKLGSKDLDALVLIMNQKLNDIRSETSDMVLSPFKGNNKDGTRRRRLDYQLARYIINESIHELNIKHDKHQLDFFKS
jgi:hypothetical protein